MAKYWVSWYSPQITKQDVQASELDIWVSQISSDGKELCLHAHIKASSGWVAKEIVKKKFPFAELELRFATELELDAEMPDLPKLLDIAPDLLDAAE